MNRYRLERDEKGMRVKIRHATPLFVVTEKGDYEVQFVAGDDTIVVTLTPDALETLGQQCVAHIPSIASSFSGALAEESFRAPLRVINGMLNTTVEAILRETQSDVLIDFLWYMKDAGIIKKVLNNMSSIAAEMILDDLNTKWRGINPDTVLENERHLGREAAMQVHETIRKINSNGRHDAAAYLNVHGPKHS